MRQEIYEGLLALADPDYQAFQSRLLPGIDGVLGVRTPALRKYSKELLKKDWILYIRELKEAWDRGEPLYYEEKLLWALCIGQGLKTWQEAEGRVREFVPVIDSWAVCDLFCGALKAAKKAPEDSFAFVRSYFSSDQEYELRFGAVMLLSYFTEGDYAREGLALLDQVRHEGYYVKMAVAWAVSIYFIRQPALTMEYLRRSSLDDWTYNKTIQKIRESFRVDLETKNLLQSMKRKKFQQNQTE